LNHATSGLKQKVLLKPNICAFRANVGNMRNYYQRDLGVSYIVRRQTRKRLKTTLLKRVFGQQSMFLKKVFS